MKIGEVVTQYSAWSHNFHSFVLTPPTRIRTRSHTHTTVYLLAHVHTYVQQTKTVVDTQMYDSYTYCMHACMKLKTTI